MSEQNHRDGARRRGAETPVRDRVHVVPLGFEYARLKEPIVAWKADVVVAIGYDDGEGEVSYLDELLAELRANERIALERRSCDIFDLYDALGTVTRAIADHSSDDVYVNVSAGSTVTGIAGMIACMVTGARPIYARPEYGPDGERIPDEPLHEEVAEVFELPTYPIDRPSDQLVEVMAYVDERTDDETGRYRGANKKELIEFALDREFPFVVESEATTDKGYYRLLDRHVLDPLGEKGYVEVERIGRKKFVTLTDEGENALRAFRHVVDR